MKKLIYLIVFLAGFSVLNLTSCTQKPELQIEYTRSVDPLKNYWGDIDGFLNKQALISLDLVEKTLIFFPPVIPEPFERRMALLMLDNVLHDVDAPKRSAVQQFFHCRMLIATEKIEKTIPKEGAVIWKLYDHGFVIRTANVTVGFDLIRGNSARADGFAVENEVMQRLVDQCDVLFITHRHGDHSDEWVAQSFLDQGKPVVAPEEIWQDLPIEQKITHLNREAHTKQSLSVQNGKQTLEIVVYPGHQGRSLTNNVYLIFSPSGISFAHTGDQSNGGDFSWIDEVGINHNVDILMPNCWTTDITRAARGFDPKVIITGHENELGHTIDHREPYWLTYDRMSQTSYPLVLMTWGESFFYKPE
ncbi:MBL fold metallo-hydrolase [candidate division KSB1 bacterium]